MPKQKTLTLQENIQINHNEQLYYIDFEEVYQYHHKNNKTQKKCGTDLTADEKDDYIFDLNASQEAFNQFVNTFRSVFTQNYKSFQSVDEYRGRNKQHIILANNMFEIAIENNDWSFAVELLRKPVKNNLQDTLFETFKTGLEHTLKGFFQTIYIRTGSWSVEPLTNTAPTPMPAMAVNE